MGVRSCFVFPVSAETREFHPMNEIVEWSSAKKQRSRHFTGAAHFSEWPGSDETARRWLRLPPPHCSPLPYHCFSESESNKNEERKKQKSPLGYMGKTHSSWGLEMNPLNCCWPLCCWVILECVSPFPGAVRDGGKWAILVMVNILFLCEACFTHTHTHTHIEINPHSPSSFLQKAILEWVAVWIFFSEELLFFSPEFYQQFLC